MEEALPFNLLMQSVLVELHTRSLEKDLPLH